MLRMKWRCALAQLGVGAVVLIGALQAKAAPLISVDINTLGGGYGYSASQEGTPNADGTFSLSGVGGGAAVGAAFSCDWSIVVNPDPQVTSTFTLTNISSQTQTFIMNVTLPITAIATNTVQGGYFGDPVTGTTYTDTSGDGSVTLATVGGTKFYQALVNSSILSQDLGTFTAGPTPGSIAQQSWGTPIPSAPFGPASGNIRIRWTFSLTAGDTMSTKGFFQVEPVPEPASLALVGLGLVALAGRRRA